MEFFFFYPNSAFFWVRGNTLVSQQRARLLFNTIEVAPRSVLVFNRFNLSRFFRSSAEQARALGIPYIVDIDDLFWDLPTFSSDPAQRGGREVSDVDRLIRDAALVTTTNAFLKEKLESRYPGKGVIVVPNTTPEQLTLQKGGFVVANTDSFKMQENDLDWFAELATQISDAGWPLQFIGKNANLTDRLKPFSFSVQGEMSYGEYLALLPNFRFGLVPVGNSDYSESKSSIKVIEFLSAGMEVLASDIRPYREFQAAHPELPLTLLPNERGAWKEKISSLLSTHQLPQETAHISAMLKRTREEQFAGWREVEKRLQDTATFPEPAAYEKLQSFMRNFYRIQRLANTKVGRLIRGSFG